MRDDLFQRCKVARTNQSSIKISCPEVDFVPTALFKGATIPAGMKVATFRKPSGEACSRPVFVRVCLSVSCKLSGLCAARRNEQWPSSSAAVPQLSLWRKASASTAKLPLPRLYRSCKACCATLRAGIHRPGATVSSRKTPCPWRQPRNWQTPKLLCSGVSWKRRSQMRAGRRSLHSRVIFFLTWLPCKTCWVSNWPCLRLSQDRFGLLRWALCACQSSNSLEGHAAACC